MTQLGEYATNQVYCTDALTLLRGLPDESINCMVTSPPYFGLRSYTDGDEREIGKEQTPEQFVEALVTVFREARRVLRSDGTFWLNLGDSYNGSGKGWTGHNGIGNQERRQGFRANATIVDGLASKNLLMIPARVALALQADGWYLRSDIIWAKPNPMPESVTDRPTKSHEHVFLLTKSGRYFYDIDAIREPVQDSTVRRYERGWNGNGERGYPGGPQNHLQKFMSNPEAKQAAIEAGRNKRDVWTIPTQPFPGAHFAVMPEKLVEPCILAGCPVGGIVLDMFSGSGTVARVARRHERQYLGSEINPDYVEMTRQSLSQRTFFEYQAEVQP